MKKRKLWVSVLAGFLAVVMLLSLIVGLIPTKVSAASSKEIRKQLEALKAEKKELAEQIKEVRGLYNANAGEIDSLVSQKDAIDLEITLLHEQVDNINQQIAAYATLIADMQDDLDDAEKRLQTLSEKNKERIRAMEEEGRLSYWAIIFKANDFADLLDRLDMIQEINAADRRRLAEISEAAKAVSDTQAELAQEKDGLKTVREELGLAELELEEKRTEADGILTELIAKGE